MRRSSWTSGYRTVTVPVPCVGGLHTITWRAGSLVVADHDVPGEIGLAAIGGEPPPCIAVFLAWRKLHRGFDPGVIHDLDQTLASSTSGALPGLSRVPAPVSHALPDSLHNLTVLAALVRAQRRWTSPDLADLDRQYVQGALSARVRESIDESLLATRAYRPHLQVLVECVATGGEPVSVRFDQAHQHGRLDLRVPPGWLVTVWAHGMAVIDGHMILEAAVGRGAGRAQVTALGWELEGFYRLEPVLSSRHAYRDRRGRWQLIA